VVALPEAEVRVGVCFERSPTLLARRRGALFQTPSAAPVGWPRLVCDHLNWW
jgi:hypothetical protein